MDNKKCFTFAGGPTMAPNFLKQTLDQKLFDTCTTIINTESSLLNINSNSQQFKEMAEKAKNNLQLLLNFPYNYHCWFCSGGVHLQFAGLPMNYAGNAGNVVANYTTTGWFSKLAFKEGSKILKAHSIADVEKDNCGRFTLPSQFNYAQNAVFTHFVDNETAEGIEYPDEMFPCQPGVPLLDDCSSSFLTKPIDWSKVSLAYAHSQKNCGISGVTIMILDDNLLKTNPSSNIPELCDFRVYQQKGGFPNLMNSSVIYSMMKMTENMLQNGGIQNQRYTKRANKFYDVLDKYPIYLPKVNKSYRSRINVTWQCTTPELSNQCINEGMEKGLYDFKGHRAVGGFRASLFYPVSDEAVDKLIEFLQDFGEKCSER